MTLLELQRAFNRAFWGSFSRQKIFFTFIMLVACGLLAVFCRGLGVLSSGWVAISLAFVPIFLSTGILLFCGILLVRNYHDEVKNRKKPFWILFAKSLDLMLGASTLVIPLILFYLFLWVILGIFFLLKEIPALGEVISVIFAFAPFLLILGSLVLSFLGLCLLFFAVPAIALKGDEKYEAIKGIGIRLKSNILGNAQLMVLGLLPAIVLSGFLVLAAVLTDISYLPSGSVLNIVMQWFFIMVPFALILSPAVVFFFNFATEAHVLTKPKT